MRILLYGRDTSGLINNLANGLKLLGYDVQTAAAENNPYYGHKFSISVSPNDLIASINETGVIPSQKFYDFVDQFDLFIFNTGPTLLPGMEDFPILRKMGKKIIFRNTGSNTRFLYPGSLQWNEAGAIFPLAEYEIDALEYHPYDWSQPWAYFQNDLTYAYNLAPKLYKECMCALYADAVTNGPAHTSLTFYPYFAGINTFDPTGIQPHIPGRVKPIILHAPSREIYKGTSYILACLEELKNEGVDFELVCPGKISNNKLKQLLGVADIVIDAIFYGAHGILANEGMASGCLVLGTNDWNEQPVPYNRPVVPINLSNLKEQIRRAILDLPFRLRVAEAGIEYVNAVHHPKIAASYLISCLERAKENSYDYYPTLFLDNPFRPDYQEWITRTKARLVTERPLHCDHRKDIIPPFLQVLFTRALFKTGVHPDTDMESFLRCNFTLENIQTSLLPRWDASKLKKVNKWLSIGEKAGYGLPNTEYIPNTELL